MTKKIKKTRLILTISEPMMRILEDQRKKYLYDNVQEVILEVLREKLVKHTKSHEVSLRGRPRKINSQEILARKRIFSKDGVIVPY